jgi:hypothetical protein
VVEDRGARGVLGVGVPLDSGSPRLAVFSLVKFFFRVKCVAFDSSGEFRILEVADKFKEINLVTAFAGE